MDRVQEIFSRYLSICVFLDVIINFMQYLQGFTKRNFRSPFGPSDGPMRPWKSPGSIPYSAPLYVATWLASFRCNFPTCQRSLLRIIWVVTLIFFGKSIKRIVYAICGHILVAIRLAALLQRVFFFWRGLFCNLWNVNIRMKLISFGSSNHGATTPCSNLVDSFGFLSKRGGKMFCRWPLYTGWPIKSGTAYNFQQYRDAIIGISVWSSFSWEKRYQDEQFWFRSLFSREHFVRQCRGLNFSLFSLN